MKSSLFKTVLLASVLALSVGCGKEKKGGGSNNGYGFNPIISPNMPVSGQTALTNLKTWYAAAETPTLGFRGTFVKKTVNINSFSFEGSFCFLGKGINCSDPAPTHCFRKNLQTNNYDLGTASGSGINDCSITNPDMTKANNQELSAAVNGSGYQLIDVQQQGPVYFLVYGINAYQPQVIYTIDTNYHSILNPVQVQTISNGAGTKTVIEALKTYNY